MKKLIDKFWVFWSKLRACWRLLTKSKTTTWVVLFEDVNENGERTMTYQVEQTANASAVYALLHTGLIHTGSFVVRGLKEKSPVAYDIVEKNMKASEECMEMFRKMGQVAQGDIQTITELLKDNK